MNYYQQAISKLTGVTDEATLQEIEEMMRTEYHTLNHLSATQFKRCALECWSAVQFMRTPEGIAYVAKLEADMLGN